MALCKRNCNKLIDIVRGRTYNLSGLKDLKKLRSLTLRDLAGPRAGLDLSQLPISKYPKPPHKGVLLNMTGLKSFKDTKPEPVC